MLLTGAGLKVFEVHPPHAQTRSNAALFRQAIGDAAQLGYNVLQIAGREPLLSLDLPALLRKGRERGMLNTLVTDAALLTQRWLDDFAPLLDFLVVDLGDESHVEDRGRVTLEKMEAQLFALQNSRVAFGFAFALRPQNLNDLDGMVECARSHEAMLLHVRLAHNCGNMNVNLGDCWAMLERHQQNYRDKLHVSTAMMRPRQAIEALHRVMNADLSPRRGWLPRLLSPLVVQSDGRVVPLQCGFPSNYEMGDLTKDRLLDQATRWLARKAHPYTRLARSLSSRLVAYQEDTFVNLHELIATTASISEPAPQPNWTNVRTFPDGRRVFAA